MSATEAQPAVQKQFGKGTRSVPHPSQKAKKWYPTSDVAQPRKVSQSEVDVIPTDSTSVFPL